MAQLEALQMLGRAHCVLCVAVEEGEGGGAAAVDAVQQAVKVGVTFMQPLACYLIGVLVLCSCCISCVSCLVLSCNSHFIVTVLLALLAHSATHLHTGYSKSVLFIIASALESSCHVL